MGFYTFAESETEDVASPQLLNFIDAFEHYRCLELLEGWVPFLAIR